METIAGYKITIKTKKANDLFDLLCAIKSSISLDLDMINREVTIDVDRCSTAELFIKFLGSFDSTDIDGITIGDKYIKILD